MLANYFSTDIKPDWKSLIGTIKMEMLPDRVYHIELFLDPEIQDAVCSRFALLDDDGDAARSCASHRAFSRS